MSIASLAYERSPVWLQNLFITGYGAYLRQLRYGGIHRRELAALLASQWYPRRTLDELQRGKLRNLLSFAKREVPYYAGIPDVASRDPLAVLREVSLLTKSSVRAAGDDLIAASHRGGSHVTIHTGGTTGTPLTIPASRDAIQRNYAFFARLRRWAGAPSGTRTATFAGRLVVSADNGYPYWRRNFSMNTLLLSSYHLSEDAIPQYARELSRFQPALIDTYPSSIEPIARYLLCDDTVTVRPQALITSSETLLGSTRDRIERAFGCPVFDHYGAAEMAAFISQCEAGTYHINPEFGIVEILKDGEPAAPGEEGQIVATGFVNPVMPFIRYATGDLAVQGDDQPCICGRAFPKLNAVIGRIDDVIVTPDGRRVGRLDPIFKVLETIQETRIVQDTLDHVRAEVVADARTDPAEFDRLAVELAKRLGPQMRVDVVPVSNIERTARGKLRTVVNMVPSRRQPDDERSTD